VQNHSGYSTTTTTTTTLTMRTEQQLDDSVRSNRRKSDFLVLFLRGDEARHEVRHVDETFTSFDVGGKWSMRAGGVVG
jgi:hypothetical protein